jgi:hypothetical protein
MNEKHPLRITFENWYLKRFPQSSLESGHGYGAWYGWMEAYDLAKKEIRESDLNE